MSRLSPAFKAFALATILIVAGCSTEAHFEFARAYGPHLKPLPIACFKAPLKRAFGYINTPVQVTPLWNGDWLVADGGNFNRTGSKVVMFSPTGTPIWAVTSGSFDFIHSAYPTTRGNILISDTNNNRVIEVDPTDCKLVFTTDDLGDGHGYLGRGRLSDGSQLLYPNDAKEIPNGHYLISSRLNNTIFEIDRHGHIFWKCNNFTNLQGKPDHLHGQHNPQRLPNGDTLISDSDAGRVIIVNRNCTHMVWEYSGHPPYGHQWLEWPRDATMMRNGDILIDDSVHNRCIEVNWQHVTVRKYYDLPQPYSCWPLKNGLVATGDTNTHGIVLWAPGTPQAAPVGLIPSTPIKNPNGKPPSHLVNGGFETPESPCDSQYCGPGPPSGAVYGWQEDDLLTESLPPEDVNGIFSYDASVSHNGNSSGRISWERKLPNGKIAPHAPLWFGQVVKVFPYRKYQLSYWMTTHNVRFCKGCDFGRSSTPGQSAYMAAQLLRLSPYANPNVPSFPKISGTTGWTYYSQTFYVPQGTHFLNLQCLLTGAGTAWFDDVQLRMTPFRLHPGQ
ncbi:MAG TPA: hypothetical protein VG815_17880 [Chloroflexota bacterium]|jgi:hypothetical protein|nr:hypothetical protein [Chloroflexota bacterium]